LKVFNTICFLDKAYLIFFSCFFCRQKVQVLREIRFAVHWNILPCLC